MDKCPGCGCGESPMQGRGVFLCNSYHDAAAVFVQTDICKLNVALKRITELEEVNAKVEALNAECIEERQQIRDLVEHCGSVKLLDCVRMTVQRLTEREQDVEDLKADNERLEAAVSEAETQRKCLLNQIEEWQQLAEKTRVDRNDAQALANRRWKQIGEQQAELEAKDRDIAWLRQELELKDKAIKRVQQEQQAQRVCGEQQQAQLNQLCEELETRNQDISRLKQERDRQRNQAIENALEVVRLREDGNAQQVKIAELEAKLRDARQLQIVQLEAKVQQLEKELADHEELKERNKTLHYERNLAHENVAQRVRQIDAVRQKLANANELAFDRLKQIADRQKRIEDLEEELSKLRAKCEDYDKHVGRVQILAAENKQLKEERDQAEISAYPTENHKVTQLEEALAKEQHVNRSLQRQLEATQTQLRSETRANKPQEDRIKELEDEAESLRRTYQSKLQDVDAMLKQRDEAEKEGEQLKAEVARLRNCLTVEVSTEAPKLEQLEKELRGKKNVIRQLLRDNYDLQEKTDRERTSLRRQRSELEMKLHEQTAKVKELQQALQPGQDWWIVCCTAEAPAGLASHAYKNERAAEECRRTKISSYDWKIVHTRTVLPVQPPETVPEETLPSYARTEGERRVSIFDRAYPYPFAELGEGWFQVQVVA